jgi:hypothetical protein
MKKSGLGVILSTKKRCSAVDPRNRPSATTTAYTRSTGFRFDYSDVAGTKIGGLFFGGKKWVRSLSSCENTWSRVVSRNLNL